MKPSAFSYASETHRFSMDDLLLNHCLQLGQSSCLCVCCCVLLPHIIRQNERCMQSTESRDTVLGQIFLCLLFDRIFLCG